MSKCLNSSFYEQDVLIVAPLLLGKVLARKMNNGQIIRTIITEVEAYRGEEDSACHARFGKTKRTAPLYEKGGQCYVYLCYGVYYLLNVVTGEQNIPQAVLIRGVAGHNGPGKLSKFLAIDKSINEEDLVTSDKIWIEDDGTKCEYITTKRVGIDYASEPYKSIKWRFVLKNK